MSGILLWLDKDPFQSVVQPAGVTVAPEPTYTHATKPLDSEPNPAFASSASPLKSAATAIQLIFASVTCLRAWLTAAQYRIAHTLVSKFWVLLEASADGSANKCGGEVDTQRQHPELCRDTQRHGL